MGKGRQLLGPGEFFQHTAQVDHTVCARDRPSRVFGPSPSLLLSDDTPLLRPDTVEVRPPARQDASQLVDVHSLAGLFRDPRHTHSARPRVSGSGQVRCRRIGSLAKAFWPRQDPIGKVLLLPTVAAPVVGVAKDIDPMRVGGSDNPPAYRLRRVDARRNVMSVRFDAGASTGPGAIRAALRGLYPDLLAFPRSLQAFQAEAS